MPKKQSPLLLLACFLLALGSTASAMGLRAAGPSALLGQPLDFRVAVRLDEGERIEPECVRAEVRLGERLLPPQAVHTRVVDGPERGPTIHVQTLGRIDEPVVDVEVVVGCTSSLSRRFVLFADPPLVAPPAAPVVASLPGLSSSPGRTLIDTSAPALPAPPAVGVTAAASPDPRSSAKAPAAVDKPARPRAPTGTSAAGATDTPTAPRPRKPRKSRSTAAAATKPAPVSRLRLEEPLPPAAVATPPLGSQALDAIDEANKAVLAAIAAASAAQDRMAALEASVARLREEAQAQAALTAQLRERAAAAERRGDWTAPLSIAVVALLALAAWMWLRVREVEQLRRQAWLAVAAPAASSADEAPPVLIERSLRGGRAAAVAGGLAPPAAADSLNWDDEDAGTEPGPEPPMSRTQALVPAMPAVAAVPARGVSAEELIDLEQQVEFFVVLGQEDAAIDLLVAHLRDSGGSSPLPYLKLLDIYHRRGDEDAYRRTRDRFNLRFNALAPDWGEVDDGSGRDLEAYPDVIERIAQVWAEPVESMTVLEVLLFRHDDGRLFDLPAYRELLFLYSLARDLAGAEGAGEGRVAIDVLLPLVSPALAAGDSAAAALMAETTPSALDLREQPTAPIDLDLSAPSDSVISRLR